MTIAHPLSPYQGDGQSTEAYSREFHLTVGVAPHGANDELWAKNGAKEVFAIDRVLRKAPPSPFATAIRST
jgi:hypothetical protein